MNKKSMKNAAVLGGVLYGAVIALALTACFNLSNPGNQNDSGDDSLVNIRIDIGDGGGAAKSLSPQLAEKYFNYMEVIFVNTKGTGQIDNASTGFYRAAGFTNQQIKMSVPGGTYDNNIDQKRNIAIMLAGVRNMQTGECVLLATGVISASERKNGSTTHEAAEINKTTTRVIFKLTALTADISDSPNSAFTVDPENYGTTKIAGVKYPYFGIQTATKEIEEVTTTARLTLTGWGDGDDENNTQRFLYFAQEKNDDFILSGIGIPTGEGDESLSSTADIKWKLTNGPGSQMTGGNTCINIEFTSKSRWAEHSGMGWMSVRAPVQAFLNQEKVSMQRWIVGSGVLRNQLNAGADAEGAGIVILHGEKMFDTEIGFEHAERWEYVFDLNDPYDPAYPEQRSVPGIWNFSVESDPNNPDIQYPTYTLLGEKRNTLVRIKGTAGSTDFAYPADLKAAGAVRYIKVAENAKDVWVVLDGAKIYTSRNIPDTSNPPPPFMVGSGAEVTMILAHGTRNELINGYRQGALPNRASGLFVDAQAKLTIEDDGSLIAVSTVGANQDEAAGIMVTGGTLTIKNGNITASGAGVYGDPQKGGAAGIGVIASTIPSSPAALNIEGGTVIAVGGNGGAGIGSPFGTTQSYSVGEINISGGVVIAKSMNKYNGEGGGGAGIGGGGRYDGADGYSGGTVKISGGVVIAENGGGYGDSSGSNSGAGIGGGGKYFETGSNKGGNGGDVTINGGTVYVRAEQAWDYGIGPGTDGMWANEEAGAATNLTIGGALVFASSIKSSSGIYDNLEDIADNLLLEVSSREVVFNTSSSSSPIIPGSFFQFDSDPYFFVPGNDFPICNFDITAQLDFIVPPRATFTIPKYMTFTINSGVTLTNDGTVQVQEGGTLTLQNGSIVENNGTVNGGGGITGPGTWTGAPANP